MAGKGKPTIVSVHPGDLIPYLAVGLWAGVRPEESVRMEWQHIDFERRHIDLPAKITKDHQRRIVPMETNLIKWLMPHRPANGQGKIVVNWKWKFRAFTKAANFSPWPKDCLRQQYENLPDKLRQEGIEPTLPWLYGFKLDFRFR